MHTAFACRAQAALRWLGARERAGVRSRKLVRMRSFVRSCALAHEGALMHACACVFGCVCTRARAWRLGVAVGALPALEVDRVPLGLETLRKYFTFICYKTVYVLYNCV